MLKIGAVSWQKVPFRGTLSGEEKPNTAFQFIQKAPAHFEVLSQPSQNMLISLKFPTEFSTRTSALPHACLPPAGQAAPGPSGHLCRRQRLRPRSPIPSLRGPATRARGQLPVQLCSLPSRRGAKQALWETGHEKRGFPLGPPAAWGHSHAPAQPRTSLTSIRGPASQPSLSPSPSQPSEAVSDPGDHPRTRWVLQERARRARVPHASSRQPLPPACAAAEGTASAAPRTHKHEGRNRNACVRKTQRPRGTPLAVAEGKPCGKNAIQLKHARLLRQTPSLLVNFSTGALPSPHVVSRV